MTVLSPGLYVIGASAAVFGLLFSHLSTIILNWNEMDRKRCRLFWLVLYILLNFSLELIIEDLNVSKKNVHSSDSSSLILFKKKTLWC